MLKARVGVNPKQGWGVQMDATSLMVTKLSLHWKSARLLNLFHQLPAIHNSMHFFWLSPQLCSLQLDTQRQRH